MLAWLTHLAINQWVTTMRAQGLATILASTLGLAFNVASHADETVPKTASADLPYPIEVSLVDESPHGWTYRQSTTALPLYVSEKDSPGKSNCYTGCSMQWIPLQASPTAKAMGEWSVVQRKDGTRQWAFKGRPVYTHIHDSPDTTNKNIEDSVWHILPHFGSGATP
jgi:predicted lipoprotein with Yx(FWY)xxD motif